LILKLSYENLFKMLIDMTNTEIMEKSKISKSTLYKMKNSENITTNVLLRIYDVLKCDISDIVECVKINEYKSKFK